MTILATMPGKFGDVLWSLPTVRLLAARHGTKIDFMTSRQYSPILDLVQRQPYVLKTWTGEGWDVQETAPMTPREPPVFCNGDYEEIYHLGYREWPSQILAREVREGVGYGSKDPSLDLDEPWIYAGALSRESRSLATLLHNSTNFRIAVGFSSEHIELKMGVLLGLVHTLSDTNWELLVPHGFLNHRAREWDTIIEVTSPVINYWETDWAEAAAVIASADLFFGCLSSMWVLANAVGTPTVIMEPSPERHNPIFWRESPRNHLVIGNDGKPTFDLRHTVEMIGTVLEEIESG